MSGKGEMPCSVCGEEMPGSSPDRFEPTCGKSECKEKVQINREQAALASLAQTHQQAWSVLGGLIAERDALKAERDALATKLIESTPVKGKKAVAA